MWASGALKAKSLNINRRNSRSSFSYLKSANDITYNSSGYGQVRRLHTISLLIRGMVDFSFEHICYFQGCSNVYKARLLLFAAVTLRTIDIHPLEIWPLISGSKKVSRQEEVCLSIAL